ncbi:TPA: hypothetical protein NBR61_000392 [Corynebacterium striatum]|nr:hypothetical protein [Corynebacterium striatum]HCD3160719.1 hypothetical protein [Corynebacterium striatum]HCD3684460.1 hypothetical protein [Corynebacterium striatum]HCD4755404.1 hypothetical protein [Corynebacterium striatum]HCD5913645.1 hypothetical protein [Corynebacterium striatum]
MSNPFGADGSSGDDKFNNPTGNNDLPRYEPTNHPEDRPDYGLPSYGSYGAQSSEPGYAGTANGNTYGSYGPYGAGNLSGRNHAAPAYTGPVSATKAIGWGFRATFANWQLWILGAFALIAVTLVLSFIGAAISGGLSGGSEEATAAAGLSSMAVNILSTLFSLIVSLVVMRLAFCQIDDPATSWGYVGKNVRWVQPFVVGLVVNIVIGGLMLIGLLIFGGATFVALFNGDIEAALFNGDIESDADAMKAVSTILGFVAVAMLISWLIQPLYVLMQWFAADGESIGDAFKKGFAAGKANYGQLLLFSFLMLLLALATILTLGLGMLVIMPVSMLAQAHIMRQCANRYAPESA